MPKAVDEALDRDERERERRLSELEISQRDLAWVASTGLSQPFAATVNSNASGDRRFAF